MVTDTAYPKIDKKGIILPTDHKKNQIFQSIYQVHVVGLLLIS